MANVIGKFQHDGNNVTIFDDNSYRYDGYDVKNYPNSLFKFLDNGDCLITHPECTINHRTEPKSEFLETKNNKFVLSLNKAILDHIFEQDVLKNN